MNKLCKTRMPFAVKKSMAAILSLLMIISSFFPVNQIYAADNGEMVLKSVSHPETAVEAVIDGNNIIFTLPFGYKSETLDISGIKCKLDTNFRLAEISFPSDSEAKIGGSSVIMDVNYTYASGKDTSTKFGTRYYISVESGKSPAFGGTISKTTTINKNITFKLSDFADIYKSNNGEKMGFISIGASRNTAGILKYKGDDYRPDTLISVSDIEAGRLSFKPLNAGEISYTVTAYADDENKTDCGKASLNIKIEYPVASDIKFNGEQDKVLKLNSSRFIEACNIIGGTFDCISFDSLPSSSKGRLYIDYASSAYYGTAAATGRYYNRTDIDKMSFVPYSGYFGEFSIPYKGYNREGEIFTGEMKITVAENKMIIDTIEYSAYENTLINMDADDFKDVCSYATGRRLSYVKFTLPSASKGSLYLNYGLNSQSKVSSSSKYYEDDLENISFAPYSNYTGIVVISYVGYNDRGEAYEGEIEIEIIKIDADATTYKTGTYTPLSFDSDDLADACRKATGRRLDYIKFSVPSSSYGTMYYKYGSSRYETKVSDSTKYYVSDLDDITFVPKSSYTGAVVIPYTGYNVDGKSYTGVVKITVVKEIPAADTINISTKEDTAVHFDDEDFNDASEDSTGEELDYVIFTLPSSKYGKLYYNYTSASKYDSEVSSNRKYYYDDTPSLYRITFVPYRDYHGTVTIKYTGYNTDGDAFTGSVEVEVISMPETEGSQHFKDVTKDYSWAAFQIDYLYEQDIVNGTGDNYYGPAQNMTRGDFMLMLYRALNLRATVKGNFSDVPKDSYYYKAVGVAKALGIAKGYDDKFMPGAGITREDAMVLVDRALTIEGRRLSAGKESDLYDFKDRKTVSDYAYTSVATLVKAGIIQGSNSYLNPKSFISRAEMAVILYKVLELN